MRLLLKSEHPVSLGVTKKIVYYAKSAANICKIVPRNFCANNKIISKNGTVKCSYVNTPFWVQTTSLWLIKNHAINAKGYSSVSFDD